MGYYTSFTLHVKAVNSADEYYALSNAIGAFNMFDIPSDPQYGYVIFCTSDIFKWYDYEEDMIELSKKFPHMIFMLEGDGEEYDDFWKEYFSNGTCEMCQGSIVYKEPVVIKWDEIPDAPVSNANWSQVLNGT